MPDSGPKDKGFLMLVNVRLKDVPAVIILPILITLNTLLINPQATLVVTPI